jgi:hypothetical protein
VIRATDGRHDLVVLGGGDAMEPTVVRSGDRTLAEIPPFIVVRWVTTSDTD